MTVFRACLFPQNRKNHVASTGPFPAVSTTFFESSSMHLSQLDEICRAFQILNFVHVVRITKSRQIQIQKCPPRASTLVAASLPLKVRSAAKASRYCRSKGASIGKTRKTSHSFACICGQIESVSTRRFHLLFVSLKKISETPPTTMGRARREATLRFGGCPPLSPTCRK